MWIIKDNSDTDGAPYFVDGPPFWSYRLSDATRYHRRDLAERAMKGIPSSVRARIVRLVPKRKAMPSVTPESIAEGARREEREAIAAWFERAFPNGILGTDTARRIRAGEHRR